jgi:hypothetical protein
MVLRFLPVGARAQSVHRRPSLVLAAALSTLLLASARAQEQPPATNPPANPPANAPATGAAPAAAEASATNPNAPVVYGRVVGDKVALRCWPGAVASPPVFEDVLAKDQVVVVGRSENGFRAIALPLGPVGYVSRKFTEATADGRVKTKGSKVSFRFRPRSSEPPVSQLAEGTELQVVGEQDDWFRVRVPGIEAWVAEAEVQAATVQAGTAADPALAAAYEEWRKAQAAEVQARLDEIAAKAARLAQDQQDLALVQQVQDTFTSEMKKPLGEQRYGPIVETLDKLVATFDAKSAGRGAVESLKRRIETQTWLAEATALQNSKPPVVDEPVPTPKNTLDRFQALGWLRQERRIGGPSVFFLERGGKQECVITCSSGRFDLSLFVGREVGVNGPRRRPAQEAVTVLDVERIEVLGTLAR